jgi:hypothetical protein
VKASSLVKIPYGWLECNGQAVSRSTYSELFTKFSTQLYDDPSSTQDPAHTLLSRYGEGDGITTFNLPDYRECVLVGAGQNDTDTIAEHDVYTQGQFKDDQLQAFAIARGCDAPGDPVAYQYPRSGSQTGNGGYINYATPPVPATLNGDEPRTGTTTHGKQKGVAYIIKVL